MPEEKRNRPVRSPVRRLGDVAAWWGAAPPPTPDTEVTGVSIATDDVQPGDLFVALPGGYFHGAEFAHRAVAAGARAVLTDPAGAHVLLSSSSPQDLPCIVVDRPRERLGAMCAWFHDDPTSAFVTVGITGTQGKTTTAHLVEAAVGQPSAMIGTLGTRIAGARVASRLTTPEATQLQALFALMREDGVHTLAMEVSSHALVQGRVDGFRFDVAVFLNLGRDHLDYHRDMEEYFAAKARLFTREHARRAVVNVDDEYGRRLVDLTELPVTTFSTRGRVADWRGVNVRPHRLDSEVTVLGPDGREHELRVPLPGEFNVSNAVAVIAALSGQGRDPGALIAGIAASAGVPGRMERIDGGQEFTVVVDYAHKPDAVVAVLAALRPVTPGRLIIVIGAGGDRDRGKRPQMGRIVGDQADLAIITDDNPRSEDPAQIRASVLAGAAEGAATLMEIGDRYEAIAEAVRQAQTGDTIVIAGKGHETGQEIGGVVHPFNDRDAVLEAIAASRGGPA